jgi:alpha-beta hydrolase superfamily lysophospholipase
MDFPLWFGETDRSLLGFASVPDDGSASGAVVLCPPFGLEGVCARRTFAALGRALAQAGILALRFDYDGTGDSVGSDDDPDRVAAWVGGIHQALDLVRRSGVSRVAVVGMRLGATFATAALSDTGGGGGDLVDGLVLWDPCASGRSYLRSQRALHSLSRDQGDRGDGSVEAPGVVFGPETVAALSSLDLGIVEGPLAKKILVLARETNSQGKGALERFAAARPVERGVAHGQERLVDVEPFAAEIPLSGVETVTAWLSETLEGKRVAVSLPRRDGAVVGGGDAGPIVERVVSLGPLGLFGIVTEPQGVGTGARGAGTTAIFLNSGILDHTGPARLWVHLSRRWAEEGLRSVRCDLSGLGESSPRPGQPVDVMDAPEALDDVLDVAAAASPADPSDVVLVGLCTGGYHAIEGALALGARGVCGLNPILSHKPAELRAAGTAATQVIDTRRQATVARKRWVRALPAHDQLGALLEKLPNQVWWLVNRVAVEHSPARVLRRLVDEGVRTFIVSGESEGRLIWRGEARARRRLELSGRFHHLVVPGIDHELFKRDARELVSQIVTDEVLQNYVPRFGSSGGACET